MDEIFIYEKPTCSTCRAGVMILKENGVPYRTVRYYDEPLTEEKLTELIRKMGITPRELLRTREEKYKELDLANKNLSDTELIQLMIRYPDLMQRPIVERGNRAILGRPVEKIREFLSSRS